MLYWLRMHLQMVTSTVVRKKVRPTLLQHHRYDAGERLGQGSQGFVLRVVDRESPSRPLVAKIWHARGFAPGLLEGEFALLSRLRIAGLARAYDFGHDEQSGAPFLVEDFVEGPDGAHWIAAEKDPRRRRQRLSRLLAEVASTLAALHEAGFVHGDLKPAHVRIADRGPIKLLDLGAAVARSAEGSALGSATAITRGYAAPELLAGAAPGPASDLFALGALGWACATSKPPPSATRDSLQLRSVANWITPCQSDLIAALLARHPRDRPQDARDVLRRLGSEGSGELGTSLAWGTLVGRERELEWLMKPYVGVRYVVGPAKMGKSALVRELVTRLLLSGRAARLMSFPNEEAPFIARLLAFLRGSRSAWPFRAPLGEPLVVVLDEIQNAPRELRDGLEAYRCRAPRDDQVDFIVTAPEAPAGVESLTLGPLAADCMSRLADELGGGQLRDQLVVAGGNPGWLLACSGKAALGPDAVAARLEPLSEDARLLLAALVVAAQELPIGFCRELLCHEAPPSSKTPAELLAAATAELAEAALLTRHRAHQQLSLVFSLPQLREELAETLATQATVDKIAAVSLQLEAPRASLLLAIAGAPIEPSDNEALLRRAFAQAEQEGLRSLQIEALQKLADDGARRSPELLVALDRVTRGGGSAGLHPRVAQWLGEASGAHAQLRPLALRRQADQAARKGDFAKAQQLAEQARAEARAQQDPGGEALALATLGAIALYRADWAAADDALSEAHAMLASSDVDDAEEIARVDHNRGVVALYRDKIDIAIEAIGASLRAKRAMGDNGGVWACLLNLALALTKAGQLDRAADSLDEALRITRALRQSAGTGWCLAARVEVELKRGDAASAQRWIVQAEELGASLPASVQADLVLLRADIDLLEGDGRGAFETLQRLTDAQRQADSMIDARALVAEARATLSQLPADRRKGARLAVRAIRRAREGRLAELEQRAIEVLRQARGQQQRYHEAVPIAHKMQSRAELVEDGGAERASWSWLNALASGQSAADAAVALARMVAEQSGAERVFVALVNPSARVDVAWGADLDGLALADPAQRISQELLDTALRRDGPVYLPSVETRGGLGSQLAIAATVPDGELQRALVVAEHRFREACFDDVTAARADKWAVLAALIARVHRGTASPSRELSAVAVSAGPLAEASRWSNGETTSVPLPSQLLELPAIVGSSPALRRAMGHLSAAASSELPVLILGETGVGKELFARAVHEAGQRATAPFVAVSCAAIPDTLFEAELFGHARGSFTGAERERPGLLARAEGGTLLLDEIGELPAQRQATLLRALESRRYRPVGCDDERPFDVRVIAATNRDLAKAVEAGTFRGDLYYRLNVLAIQVPPLRERPVDVPQLARSFLDRAGCSAELSAPALSALASYHWPGNVRQLEHLIQRLAALNPPRIEASHLPREIRSALKGGAGGQSSARKSRRRARPKPESPEQQRKQIADALALSAGNITHAARHLGITRQGLKKRMVRLGIRPAPAPKLKTNSGLQ